VEEIYLPLSRLLSMYVVAHQRLYVAQRKFLGIEDRKMPYIIGVAGSVAVAAITGVAASRMAAVSKDRTGEEDRRLKQEDIESAPGYESYSCEPNQIGISCIG
jgi:pantothenate kinase